MTSKHILTTNSASLLSLASQLAATEISDSPFLSPFPTPSSAGGGVDEKDVASSFGKKTTNDLIKEIKENILPQLIKGECLYSLDLASFTFPEEEAIKLVNTFCIENNLTNQLLLKTEEKVIFLIRRLLTDLESFLDIRVAVIGNVDAGKSTMLGVLTKGSLDDGRGKARVDLFRHKHELESGRTSCIGQELLGISADGSTVNATYTTSTGIVRRLGWEDVCLKAFKVYTFMDLAGHEKYLKTTMFGLTGCSPDYAMLMVGANAGMIGMAKEHLALAFALSTPVFIVITKIDSCPAPVLQDSIRQLTKILKSTAYKRTPIMIKDSNDIILTVQNFGADRLCPIFQVSNVTGEGINLLLSFMNLLPTTQTKYDQTLAAEFQISETYSVPGVGAVVSGTMLSGVVKTGDKVLIGPDDFGQWSSITVKSIQRKRIDVQETVASQCASFALKKWKRNQIRKGMIIVSSDYFKLQPLINPTAKACLEFEAEVIILFHSTTIGAKYQAMLHCGVVRQTAQMTLLSTTVLRTGDRSVVKFTFIQRPEFLKVGMRMLFREGRTKGVGRITRLL